MAPARTGRDSRRSTVVTFTDQINKGTRSRVSPPGRILIMVEMKLMDPRIEEMPARCREKMARSTEAPAWASVLDRGG